MTTQQSITDGAHRKNLRLLMTLRGLAVCAQLAAIFVTVNLFNIVLPVVPMVAIAGGLAAFNIYTLLRLRSARPVTQFDLLLALAVDILVLTLQLHLSDGAANPFVSFYMLPVIVGAVILDTPLAWGVFGLTVAGYLALLGFAPTYPTMAGMEHMEHAHGGALIDRSNLHMTGMMIGYFLCAACMVAVVSRVRRNLSLRDQELQEVRTRALEQDHILRTGLLAAGAAHELGSPLTTLSIILKDWQELSPPKRKADRDAELETMAAQVDRCKIIISDILAASGQSRGEGATTTTLGRFLEDVTRRWQTVQKTTLTARLLADDTPIVADRLLEQSLFNLLDNALEASKEAGQSDVILSSEVTENALTLKVSDRGKGFVPELLASPGQPFQSTKSATGRGLGLFLVRNTAQALGGSLEVQSSLSGSTVTLVLPLEALKATHDG